MSAPKSKQLYRTSRWRNRVRKQVLHDFGYRCVQCGADLSNAGKLAQVHHRVPLERAPHRGFDQSNLEPLCIQCHNTMHGRGTLGCDASGSPLDRAHPWNIES